MSDLQLSFSCTIEESPLAALYGDLKNLDFETWDSRFQFQIGQSTPSEIPLKYETVREEFSKADYECKFYI